MGILKQEIRLAGSKGESRRTALFDSGASYSIIRRDIAEEIHILTPVANPDDWIFETAEEGHLVTATHLVALDFHFDDSETNFHDEFVVFDNCSEEVVIGARTMQYWKIKLDFDRDEIGYPKEFQRLRLMRIA